MASAEKSTAFTHSVTIARKVLPFLGRLSLPATPENYIIFYLYFDSPSDGVKQLVETHLNSGRPWVEETTALVFEQLFGAKANLDLMRANQDLAHQVNATASGLISETTASAKEMREKSRDLADNLTRAVSLSQGNEFQDWLKGAMEQVSQVRRASEDLDLKLKDRGDQLADLMGKLAQMERMALVDELTQLANRRAWDTRMSEEYERHRRLGKTFSVFLLDIDNFKMINDSFGHQVGDQGLKSVAGIIRHCVRESDFPARYGGEEFTCLFPETELKEAVLAAETVRGRLAATHFTVKGRPVSITASIGVASFRAGDDNPEQCLKRADMSMYLAKSKGKNRVYSEVELAAAREAMF